MQKVASRIKFSIAIIICGILMYFSNLHWLSLYDKPNLRGNHVGLTALTGLVFWAVVLAVRRLLRKKTIKTT